MDGVIDFPLPPENMLSEQIVLPDHRLALGLIHSEGEREPRIVTWDGERFRHLTADAARSAADWYDAQPEAAMLKPAADALRTLADRAEEIAALVMFRRAGRQALADMRVEGHA